MTIRFNAGIPQAPLLPSKARLATWQEIQAQHLKKLPEAFHTATSALGHYKASDHQLADFNDANRVFTVATIASLGSLDSPQPGAPLPLWLGAGSWLGAMALTPRIINGAIYLKTGVNLNAQYLSSNGVIRPLFQDPGYMPLQVLPEAKRQQLMQRLGIPLDNPDRESLLQERLKQIAVQAHTWWMLMAGFATPVFASTLSDIIENPAKSLYSWLRAKTVESLSLKPALQSKNPQRIIAALEKTIRQTIGSGSETTMLARWWKRLPTDVMRTLQLQHVVDGQFLKASEQERFERIAQHLYQQLHNESVRNALVAQLGKDEAATAMEGPSFMSALGRIFAPLEKALEQAGHLLPHEARLKAQYELDLQKLSAQATLKHLRELAELFENDGDMAPDVLMDRLKECLEKPVLPYIEQLVREGRLTKATEVMGSEEQVEAVMNLFRSGRFKLAFLDMGAAPKEFFLQAMESLALRHRWTMGYRNLLLAFMGISTAIFVAFFVGRQFKSSDGEG